MKEILYHGIPIDGRMPLFNAEMRQAVRDDRKGQTRRPIDPQLKKWSFQNGSLFYSFEKAHKGVKASSVGPFGNEEQAWRYFINKHCPWTVGDVRCMCEPLMRNAASGMAHYRDDWRLSYFAAPAISLITGKPIPWRWKRDTLTSIHMPTEAARTICRVTDIRVERVQDIDYDDVIAEGVKQKWTCISPGLGSYAHDNDVFDDFQALWNLIYAKRGYSFDVNPHVWVNVFEQVM